MTTRRDFLKGAGAAVAGVLLPLRRFVPEPVHPLFDSFVAGIGRQSPMMLDNMGLQVSYDDLPAILGAVLPDPTVTVDHQDVYTYTWNVYHD